MDNNQPQYTFKFLSYYFDPRTYTATFAYQGINNFIFSEHVTFAKTPGRRFNITGDPSLNELVDRAVFLAFILIGTSYFKAHPTPNVEISHPLDQWQADFFNKVYQEGLSQFAFENHLTRDQLAHFHPSEGHIAPEAISYQGQGVLSLQSGGKDSILTATILSEKGVGFESWYVSSTDNKTYPEVLDQLQFPKRPFVAVREVDLTHLEQAGGMSGHVPVTYILESLAIIQAILMNRNTILVAIGQEGNEPHGMIGDLPVNHQWSKSWEAEQLLAEYVRRYLSPDLKIGSPLRSMSELFIAEQFIYKCWQKYGFQFSSCNVFNYKQGNNNTKLGWCGHCAKCVNTYLLFAPFLAPAALKSIMGYRDLFALNPEEKSDQDMINIFKGLLGVDGVMKPFECVGTVEELRTAYAHRQPDYAALPFPVPPGNFDYRAPYPMQDFIKTL